MIPYWVLFSFFAVGALNHKIDPHRQARLTPLMLVTACVLVLFVGLRYQVGADWIPYQEMFAAAGNMTFAEIASFGDPGYMLLNGLGQQLGFDIWFVNIGCALIFAWGLYRFALHEPNPWLSIAAAIPYLVIVVAMGYSRQAVAIGIIMASLSSFEKGKYAKFLVYIAVASTFHKTAVAILPIIALSAVRARFVVYAVAAALGSVLFIFFLDSFLDSMMAGYLDTELASDGASIRVAMNVIPSAVYLLFQRRFARSVQERALWRNFAVASLAMIPALAILPSTTAVDRVTLYLMPIQVFALGRLPFAFPNNGKPNVQLTVAVLVYSAAIQGVWLTFAAFAEWWVPYRAFLFV